LGEAQVLDHLPMAFNEVGVAGATMFKQMLVSLEKEHAKVEAENGRLRNQLESMRKSPSPPMPMGGSGGGVAQPSSLRGAAQPASAWQTRDVCGGVEKHFEGSGVTNVDVIAPPHDANAPTLPGMLETKSHASSEVQKFSSLTSVKKKLMFGASRSIDVDDGYGTGSQTSGSQRPSVGTSSGFFSHISSRPGGSKKNKSRWEKESNSTNEYGWSVDQPSKAKATLFPHATSMKEIIKGHLHPPSKQASEVDLYKEEGVAQKFARSRVFDTITLAVICVNSVWISIDMELNNADALVDAPLIFVIAEQGFCVFFTLELLMRFVAFKQKHECWKSPWFIFDFLLVSLMITESWFLPMAMQVGRSGNRQMSNSSVLKVARILKLLRMLRLSRLMSSMPEIFILVKGIASATRAVLFTLVFLVIVLYVFAITFFNLLRDTEVGAEKFPTILISMQTLLVHGTLLDDLNELVMFLQDQLVCLILLYLLIVVAAITLMNMLIGVLCEATSAVAEMERNVAHVNRVSAVLIKATMEGDDDFDGLISQDEFVKILASGPAIEALEEIGVDPLGLIDVADTIFVDNTAGMNGAGYSPGKSVATYDKKLTFDEFMEVLLQFRGSNKATVKDVVELRKEVQKSQKLLEKMLYCVLHIHAHDRKGVAAKKISRAGNKSRLTTGCFNNNRTSMAKSTLSNAARQSNANARFEFLDTLLETLEEEEEDEDENEIPALGTAAVIDDDVFDEA
jgi:voltage-gated sodium channel